MHSVFEFAIGAFHHVLALVAYLAAVLASLRGRPVNPGDYAIAKLVAASIFVGLICIVWTMADLVRGLSRREATPTARRRAQSNIRFREPMISAHPKAAAVSTDEPGTKPEAVFCTALDALPIPVWIRNKHLVLTWANEAFLAFTGAPTMRDALLTDASLDCSERDLARAASEGAKIAATKRYAVMDGQRRALEIDMRRLPDGGVAGFAVDVTDLVRAEAKLHLNEDAFGNILNAFDTAVAIFGSDRRLTLYNAAYARMWQLPESWLDTRPTLGDILDRLRETRRLPEQRDFACWKREHMAQFEETGRSIDETWHSPAGTSIDVRSFPYLPGGAIYLFRDISERLRMEASYHLLVRSQRAMLNTINEAMAVFGPDGRLKLHNDAFVRLWRLDDDELRGGPHLSKVADLCAAHTGHDGIWSIVSVGVNSTEPARYGDWGQLARADGRSLSLTLYKLPEGATLVTFTDVTDLQRFQTILRDDKHSSVA